MPAKKTKKTTSNTSCLSTWLFKQPLIFAVSYFVISTLLVVLFTAINALFNTDSFTALLITLFIALIGTAYYLIIKKLPHDDMHRNDLIAITNGCSIIAIILPLIFLLFVGSDVNMFQRKMMWMYLLHPNILMFLGLAFTFMFLYLIGVALSGIYAKYKRATTMGISKWKVLCSMPFGFLLLWTPGYLIPEKNSSSNLKIKSNWYSAFNKWVISDMYNTLVVFLGFLLLRNIFSGLALLLLTTALLGIYFVWYLKYKTNLTKIMNKGYALSAVVINITAILITLLFS